MNLRLCRWARQAGWKILYFIPPGSWRRDRQGADIPKLADEVVTNFPWSADLLTQMGATAHFYGHPLLEIHADVLKSDLPRSGLAVLPGSRRSELEQLLPILGQALSDYPGTITIPVPPRHLDLVRRRWNRSSDQIIDGSKNGAVIGTLKSAERAIVCSGTATLEAALAKTPMVAIYRVSKMVEIETKIIGFKRPEFVSQQTFCFNAKLSPNSSKKSFTQPHFVKRLTTLTLVANFKGLTKSRRYSPLNLPYANRRADSETRRSGVILSVDANVPVAKIASVNRCGLTLPRFKSTIT